MPYDQGMDQDLTHLPPRKRDDLQRIAALIRERCPGVGLIILFGSYARGGWKEAKDLDPDRKSGHASDYDILAITDSEEGCSSLAWYDIAEACKKAGLSAWPSIIHHPIDYVNRKLELGQYFFSDIIAEGRVIYDAGTFHLSQRKDLSKTERLEVARDDFETWMESAEQFYEGHKFYASKGWWKKAAFNLHQTAEASFKTVLLLFTGYIPDEHYLSLLGAKARQVDPLFGEFFQAEDAAQQDAYTKLEYAYIGARYDKRYTIDEPTVRFLAERVAELLRVTGEKCREKIAALERAAGGA